MLMILTCAILFKFWWLILIVGMIPPCLYGMYLGALDNEVKERSNRE